MTGRVIEVDKALIPYRFRVNLGDSTFEVEVFYNLEYDYFTVNLWYLGALIVQNEKLMYGKQLFTNLKYLPLPAVGIIPLDLSGQADRITFENLGESVFLYVIEEGDISDI